MADENETPAKKANPSLRDLVSDKKEDKPTPAKKAAPVKATSSVSKEEEENKDSSPSKEEENKEQELTPGTHGSPEVKEEDIDSSLNANDDRLGPEDEDESDSAPGHGIISEKKSDEEDDATPANEVEVESMAIRSRINKLSPPGMTHLDTYSGGSDPVEHDRLDVIVKPLGLAENRAQRTIIDETGKSRLLHPDIVEPAIPSEQATITTVSKTHVYAEAYDPEAGNKR